MSKKKEVEKPQSEEVPVTEEAGREKQTEESPVPGEEPAEAEPHPEQEEGPAEEVDELTALRQELEEQKAKAAEYLDGWQRARAEFANYKKRIEKEQEDMIKSANGAFITKLLPVMDDFERAFLEQEGVTVIETEGQMFDPTLHQAVTHEENEEHEEGQIMGEVQKGYRMGDKVLRPSLVRVAKAISGNK